MEPPEYSTSNIGSSSIDSTLTTTTTSLLISPLNSNISYQSGNNFDSSWCLIGEVQIKFDNQQEEEFKSLEIKFIGIERNRVEQEDDIILFELKELLCESSNPSHASSERGIVEGKQLNSINKFKLSLTPDLPQCIHSNSDSSQQSSIEYSLVATLSYKNSTLPPIIKSTPIHLIRTSPPGPLTIPPPLDSIFTLSPKILSLTSLLSIKVRFDRTVFKKSEPIKLITKIEVPSSKLLQEEGLRLRTISAELKRRIGRSSTVVAGSSGTGETLAGNSESTSDSDDDDQVRVIARSGKSCRFSPTRPILIKLILRPPATMGCESISQSTILHDVSFFITVTIAIISESTRTAAPLHITIPILVLPDSPPPSLPSPSILPPNSSQPTRRSEKQREVEVEAQHSSNQEEWNSEEGRVPAYHEVIPSPPPLSSTSSYSPPPPLSHAGESSTSYLNAYTSPGFIDEEELDSTGRPHYRDYDQNNSWDHFQGEPQFGDRILGDPEEEEEEEEYDGYEELSASLSNVMPPPTIDEDCSPPSVLDDSSDSSDSVISQSQEESDSVLPTFDEVVPSHSHSNLNLSSLEASEEVEAGELDPPSFAEVVQVSEGVNTDSTVVPLTFSDSQYAPHFGTQESIELPLPSFSSSSSSSPSSSSSNLSRAPSSHATAVSNETSSYPQASEHEPVTNIGNPTSNSINTDNIVGGVPPPPYVNLGSPTLSNSTLGVEEVPAGGIGEGVVVGVNGPPPYLY